MLDACNPARGPVLRLKRLCLAGALLDRSCLQLLLKVLCSDFVFHCLQGRRLAVPDQGQWPIVHWGGGRPSGELNPVQFCSNKLRS